MNSEASHFLFFSFDDEDAFPSAEDTDFDDPELEDTDLDDVEDEEDDPFENNGDPWEYDDRDDF